MASYAVMQQPLLGARRAGAAPRGRRMAVLAQVGGMWGGGGAVGCMTAPRTNAAPGKAAGAPIGAARRRRLRRRCRLPPAGATCL